MPYEEKKALPKAHNVSMENRGRLSLDGVEDVSGFDEHTIVLRTTMGDLTVRGENLHIGRIDLELGRLELDGHIQELSYDEPAQSGSFWARLFS